MALGCFAIAVICENEPYTLVCARKGSPLIIGIAENSYVVASDASAIISHTTQVITLEDYQVARLCAIFPAASIEGMLAAIGLLIIVMVLRPRGLLGEETREAG